MQDLSFRSLVSLAIAEGATTPVPSGNSWAWSTTLNRPVFWNGTIWTAGTAGDSFESISKNIKSWQASYTYNAGTLINISYTQSGQTITKTFTYTAGTLTSITLSGNVPSGVSLTKTFNYTSGVLTSVSYG